VTTLRLAYRAASAARPRSRRQYAPPSVITDENGRELIPVTTAEARRLFNVNTRVTRPTAFHQYWSD
jgi:hypothetical protein